MKKRKKKIIRMGEGKSWVGGFEKLFLTFQMTFSQELQPAH